MKSKNYYAYFIPRTKKQGVVASWAECEKLVKGVYGARYRGFESRAEAEAWLNAGAFYEIKPPRIKAKLIKGIYFDAGTGRGKGVEISVTDEKGKDLLHKVLSKKQINKFGKHLVGNPRTQRAEQSSYDGKQATNNYGELLACLYAMEIAIKDGIKKVFGDSKLVIDYWSRGYIKQKEVASETVELAQAVTGLREEFEEQGGRVGRVSGDDNPADLGFHK